MNRHSISALSLNCYYGSTDDGDDDPEDDWDSSCTGNTYVDCTVSCGDNDGTKVPACFKVRFGEGERKSHLEVILRKD